MVGSLDDEIKLYFNFRCNHHNFFYHDVMFKKLAAVFYRDLKTTRRSRVVLDPIKHVLRVF